MPKTTTTINLQVTEKHLNKARRARARGDRISQSCIVAQALAEAIPDFEGCAARSFTYGGTPRVGTSYRAGVRSGTLGGARVLVSYYDNKRYAELRALLPITIAATFPVEGDDA